MQVVGLVAVLSGSIAAVEFKNRFSQFYALGDSITDTGNYFGLAGSSLYIQNFYKNKKFTNDKTWVEYLQERLEAKDFENFAVARATSDTKSNEALIVNNQKIIPGCVQQAEQLTLKLSESNNPGETLVSIAFFGNDFFVPRPDIPKFFENMQKCISIVADSQKVGNILIPITAGVKYYPYLETNQYVKEGLTAVGNAVDKTWPAILNGLKAKYPKINFYGLDYDKILGEMTLKHTDYKIPCIDKTPFEIKDDEKVEVCKNPKSRMFFDLLHPSSLVHQQMAESTLNLLKPKAKPSSLSYKPLESNNKPTENDRGFLVTANLKLKKHKRPSPPKSNSVQESKQPQNANSSNPEIHSFYPHLYSNRNRKSEGPPQVSNSA